MQKLTYVVVIGVCSMSTMFLKSVWLQNSVRARAVAEKKACVVGLTRLLCESELCLSDLPLWGEVLVADVKLLEEDADGAVAVKDEDESLLELEQTGYEAGYSKLYFASATPIDYLSEYPPPSRYLAESIAKLSAARPGVVRCGSRVDLSRDAEDLLCDSYLLVQHIPYAQSNVQSPEIFRALQTYFAQNNVPFQ